MKRELIIDWLEDRLDAAGRQEFDRLFETDAEFRREALNQRRTDLVLSSLDENSNENICAAVRQSAGADDELTVGSVMGALRQDKKRQRWRKTYLVSLAACLALLCTGTAILFNMPGKKFETVASEEEAKPLEEVKNYSQQLKEGRESLTLTSGVKLHLKGPAVYRQMPGNAFRLISGDLLAEVPPEAVGFTVHTPDGTVTDLGTVFTIRAQRRRTLMKVLSGHIRCTNKSGGVIELKGGERRGMSRTEPGFSEAPLWYFEEKSAERSISVNFAGPNVDGRTGLYPSGVWNELRGSELATVRDSDWQLHNCRVRISNAATYQTPEVKETAQPHQRLFKGRLSETIRSENKGGSLADLKIRISGVPYRKYRIVVYYWIGRQSDDHKFHLSVNGSREYEIHRPNRGSSENINSFVRWSGPQRDQAGNYQLFENLSGDAVVTARLGEWNRSHRSWFICGLQIVEQK